MKTISRDYAVTVWLRPSPSNQWTPRWGHADGLQLGLEPADGPRGLIRVYASYIDRSRLLNFVAIEPIVARQTERGYSELEHSSLDNVPGKRFWSSGDVNDATPRPTADARPGVIETIDGHECLTVYVFSERFDNGAEVAVRVRFRDDRPHQVALAAFRLNGSAELAHCVLSATMGNYARLRQLHLNDGIVTPEQLWPGFSGTDFTEHARFPLDSLTRDGDTAGAYATPDESDPQSASYAPGVAEHWKYTGVRAKQGWRAVHPSPEAAVQVNARATYWASASPIPAGPAFENFEFIDTFRSGQEYVYYAEPCDTDGTAPVGW